MTTKNRRVATYLSEELEVAFTRFKSDRQLGDSQALIAILTEFLGVTHSEAHKSESLITRAEFEDSLRQLRSELLGELSSELKAIRGDVELRIASLEPKISSVQQVKDELLSELKRELPKESEVPGQLQLIPDQSQVISELLGELKSEPENENLSNALKPMTGALLSQRFKIHANSVTNKKNATRGNLDEFIEWTKRKDPDGIAWEPKGKLFYPMIPSNQVNPLPEGSERSEEG